MKEIEFLNIIKQYSKYIGDDCAYLKNLGIVITQDNLIEDVHFKTDWATPYQIGYKSAAVNISDILASGAEPKYLTIGLSLPKTINKEFIDDFYKGVVDGSYGAEIVGGDITGADKISISICAIGLAKNRNISSRKFAKSGYKIILSGDVGTSAYGLELLKSNNNLYPEAIEAHLMPQLDVDFSKTLAIAQGHQYAMMDTSDGLADALYKIADASNVTCSIELSKIPHPHYIVDINYILFGGEDYKLVAAIPEKYVALIKNPIVIGEVIKREVSGAKLIIDGKKYFNYDELSVYNHFED